MKTIIIHDFIKYNNLPKPDSFIPHIQLAYMYGRYNMMRWNKEMISFLKDNKIRFTTKSV